MNPTAAQTVIIAVIMIAAVVIIARFELLCLRELARSSDADLLYLTRAAWAAAIILMIPLGGIAFLYRGRLQ